MQKNFLKNRRCVKNVPDWSPTNSDYCLLFCECNGLWLECSHNLPQFSNMTLADYLAFVQIIVPDYCQFLRVVDRDRNLHFEYRCYGSRVRIDVHKLLY